MQCRGRIRPLPVHRFNNRKEKQIMREIDYTKVTANEVRLNCKECNGDGTLHALVFINEDGEVTAYHHDGCYICESN